MAPPAAHKAPESAPSAIESGSDKILHKLRLLADPDIVGVGRGFSGDVGSQGGAPFLPSKIKEGKVDVPPSKDDRTMYQARVKPFVQNSISVTAQAVISADRRYVRLSVSPVFNTLTGFQPIAGPVINPTIPGTRLPR